MAENGFYVDLTTTLPIPKGKETATTPFRERET